MSDLDNAINSINASAAKAENTAGFLDDMSTFDDQSSVTNPNNGRTVASIPKQVKDRTDELFTAAESDINQAVADAAQSATDAQDAADSIGRYQGLWPDSGGAADKGDTYQTQVSGTPTGQYFTALQNTTADPVGDNVNWREVISVNSLSYYTDIVFDSASDMLLGNPVALPVGAVGKTKAYHSGEAYGGATYINRGQGSQISADGKFNLSDSDGNLYELRYDSGTNLTHGGLKLDDETQDAGAVLQTAFDIGLHEQVTNILPAGTFYWSTTALAHRVRPKARGYGQSRTIIIPSSNLRFDTSRLNSEVDLPAEYATNALIVTTRVRSLDNNTNRGDQWIDIGGFTFDADGTGFESDDINVVFSAGQSQGQVVDIDHIKAGYAYYAKALSDGNSRHYYMDFKNLVGSQSSGNVIADWSPSLSETLGTSWQINKCSGGRWKKSAYTLKGLSYTNVFNSSYDNGPNGTYGWDFEACSSVTMTGAAAESRLQGVGSGFIGGGLIRAIDSNIDIDGGNWIGGDRDGVGTGSISNYDDGSGTVSDGLIVVKSVNGRSRVTFENTVPDFRKDATNEKLPIVATGSNSSMHYLASGNDWVITDLQCLSGAIATYIGKDGSFGTATDKGYFLSSATSAKPENTEKLQANTGDTPTDFDLFALASAGDLFAGVAYRANLGQLGLADYTTINWPSDSGPFGLVEYVKSGSYQYLEVQQNNGDLWRSVSGDGGVTFSAWRMLNN